MDPRQLPPSVLAFLDERHLATLTTLRPDGTPHVVAVGFTFEPARQLVRVITFASSRKTRNLLAAGAPSPAAVCQVDGGRWLTLEGAATVTDDPARVAEAVAHYAARYRQPSGRPDRVAIELQVERVLGRA
jgi:F420H(2)-dependent biliverdin reductase